VVKDFDGHEFAFVEASGYSRCIVAGKREVDWKYRDEFALSKQKKRQAFDTTSPRALSSPNPKQIVPEAGEEHATPWRPLTPPTG